MLKVHEAWYFLDKLGTPDAFNTYFTREFDECLYSLCVDGNTDEGKAFIAFMVNPKMTGGLGSERAVIDNPLEHGHLLREDGRIEEHAQSS